jgi:hypothetical protein
MPRRPRLAAGDLAYDVLNRPVGRLPLFAVRKMCPEPFIGATWIPADSMRE